MAEKGCKTTKESGVPVFNINNGYKTTNGNVTGRGPTPKASNEAFQNNCKKR